MGQEIAVGTGVRRRVLVALIALVALLMAPAPPTPPETRGASPIAPDVPSQSDRVVLEEEWAELLVEALGLEEALPEEPEAADRFGLLCPERTVAVAEGRAVAPGELRVAAKPPRKREPGKPLRLVVSVPATALYQLQVHGVGAQRWSVDRRPVGHLDPSALGVAFAASLLPLREGPHELSVVLGRRSRVDRIELSASRPLCIAPARGWRSGEPLTYGDLARTLVRALGLEGQLPEQSEPMLVEGEHYEAASAWGDRSRVTTPLPASEGAVARAGDSPAEFAYRVRLPRPGVFSVVARVQGAGTQLWSIDGRYRVALAPPRGGAEYAWARVATAPLASGEHVIRALVPRGSAIDVIRVVQRRSTDSDYLTLLGALGFGTGAPSSYVTRSVAYASLSQPVVAELASGFTTRAAGGAPGEPLVALETELERLYSRALSPLLPPEL